MRNSVPITFLAGLAAFAFGAHLLLGWNAPPVVEALAALLHRQADTYDQSVVLYQRLPRALIAIYVGSMAAVTGYVLQGIARNPLASPSTLGINAGATLAVVSAAFLFDADLRIQGFAALCGAAAGFLACVAVARFAGGRNDPRGLSLILSGALLSMLLVGMTNALLLSDPARRADMLSWVSGNINHAYVDRLYAFWWIGIAGFAALLVLARSMTLILLGAEKAASAGVDVPRVSRVALAAAMLCAGSAVAICGPIGFVGLVVPHLVRPLVGAHFSAALPASAMAGASLTLFADFGARELFYPYVLHTGLVMDLLGGIAFAAIVKRFYLHSAAGSRA